MITPNTYFDEIFVLSIHRRNNKWIELKKRLQREEIFVEYFEGVDKNTSQMKMNYAHFLSFHPKWAWSDGNHAIMYSFLNLFNHIRKRNEIKPLDKILIFEDDVIFHKNFNELFNIQAENIPNDWDFWYLGANIWDDEKNIFIDEKKLFTYPRALSGNFSFAFKTKYLDEIINAISYSQKEGIYTTDQTIANYFHKNSNYRVYVSEPMICMQNYGFSDTENKIINERDWGTLTKKGRWFDKELYH